MIYGAESAPDTTAMPVAMQKMLSTDAEHDALAKAIGEWDVQSST